MSIKNRYIVILEGADFAGKTNIAKRLCNILKTQYFKNPAERSRFTVPASIHYEAMIEGDYLMAILEQVSFKENGIVLDRHVPSHFAYSQAYNRQFDFHEIMKIDKILAGLGAVLIFCYKTEYQSFKDDLVSILKIEELNYYFREYLQHTLMPYIELDTTDENIELQLNDIMNFIVATED